MNKSGISCRAFIQQVSEELTGAELTMEFDPSIGCPILLPPRSDAPVKLQNAGTDLQMSVLLAKNQSAESVQTRDAMTVLEILRKKR